MTPLDDELAALRINRTPERTGTRRWVPWVAAIVVLAALGGGVWIWAARERPIEVQTATVTARTAGSRAEVLNATGYVTARRRATVSSKITGKVVEVNVEEGMAVTQGQVLARLDDSSARAALGLALAQTEAARRAVRENEVRLEQAKLALGRINELRKRDITSPSEVDNAKAEVDSTDARIAALREQVRVAERQVEVQQTDLSNTIIRAPFSGVAISKDAQPGEMVSPVSAGGGFTRTGICTIVDMKSLEIEVDVNESYINRVKPGQDVRAVLDAYPEWQIPARVITTIPAADRQKATVLVRIGFVELDPRILPDMGVKVTFLRDADAPTEAARTITVVPKSAVKSVGETTFVFVVHGETVERRAVRVGGADGDRLEVQAGLNAGDRVVISPPEGLADGARIVVKES